MGELQNLRAEVDSLTVNYKQLAGRVRLMEKRFDTLNTPLWKRLLFRIDGWGPWHVVRDKPKWRIWRRWWTS